MAVNLLDLEDLKTVVGHLVEEKQLEIFMLKEKSAFAVKQLQSIAAPKGAFNYFSHIVYRISKKYVIHIFMIY